MTHEITVLGVAGNAAFFELLTGSYHRLLGSPLCEANLGPEWLYLDAPFAVLAHNTDPDPRFIYANRCAQQWFGYSWDEFTQLRSRLSAEAPEQAERDKLLASVAEKGFVAGYTGRRITKSGTRFWAQDGVIWELRRDDGVAGGQAAMFRSRRPG
jgi:PAS domain S-box-containing protein